MLVTACSSIWEQAGACVWQAGDSGLSLSQCVCVPLLPELTFVTDGDGQNSVPGEAAFVAQPSNFDNSGNPVMRAY